MSCNKKWLSPVNIFRNPDIFYPCLHQFKALLRMEMVTTKLHQTNCFPIPLWKWEIRILHGSKPKKSVAKTFAFDQTRERKDICRILWKNDWLLNIVFQINELRSKRQELEKRHSIVLEEKHALTCSLEESQERILMLEKSKRDIEQTVSWILKYMYKQKNYQFEYKAYLNSNSL